MDAVAIPHGRDAGVSITDPGAFTALLGASLLAPACALIGLGLGVLIRHRIATTVMATRRARPRPDRGATPRRLTRHPASPHRLRRRPNPEEDP